MTVNTELRIGTLEETLTVSGTAPTVDVQTTTRSQVLNREALDALAWWLARSRPGRRAGMASHVWWSGSYHGRRRAVALALQRHVDAPQRERQRLTEMAEDDLESRIGVEDTGELVSGVGTA